MAPRFTEDSYLAGRQCLKRLWLQAHRRDLAAAPGREALRRAEEDAEVLAFARRLYPGGETVSEPRALFGQAARRTAELVKEGGPRFVYGAAFEAGGLCGRCDIIERNYDGSWDLVQVKAAEAPLPHHLAEAAYLRLLMANAGLKPGRAYLLHFNTAYRRRGELEPAKLFAAAEVPALKAEESSVLLDEAMRLLRAAGAPECPEVPLGRRCSQPAPCEYRAHCRAGLPEYSIYDIPRLGWDKKDLLRLSGETSFAALRPESLQYLGDLQKLYLKVERSGEPHIDRKAVSAFLRGLRYPLYYLDFETLQPPLPLYDASGPLRQLPFQYSLHVQQVPGGPVTQSGYLGFQLEDPRPGFIKRLLAEIGPEGSIVAYNSGFEAARIKELAEDFPEYAPPLLRLVPRFADLMEPFRAGAVVHPAFKGHYSLKKVLPALVPGLGYDGLAVGNGGAARLAYDDLTRRRLAGAAVGETRAALEAYCGLDTLAMVKIVEYLYMAASDWRAGGG